MICKLVFVGLCRCSRLYVAPHGHQAASQLNSAGATTEQIMVALEEIQAGRIVVVTSGTSPGRRVELYYANVA